jgi:lipopolysaccharide/colanic/teichoic acid biosynthesis glycosyltransferase
MKRFLDVVAAGLGLLLISPVLLAAAIAVRVTSSGQVFFRQERMGRGGRPFFILKFRTMVQNAATIGGPITFGNDPRVTPIGKLLRKTKFDELPQLINVLKGDMSLVGPRPEVRRYVEMFCEDYRTILQVRPGMTDLASIKYRDEQAILGSAADPEQEYVRVVLPEKIRLAREYVARQSLWLDLGIILRTAACLLCDRMPCASSCNGAKDSS